MSDIPLTYRFASFELDAHEHRLWSDGEPIELSERAYLLLLTLAQASPELVSKESLLKRLWPDRVVSDAALARLLSDTRILLGDNGEQQQIIKTAKGLGYTIPEVTKHYGLHQTVIAGKSRSYALPVAGAIALTAVVLLLVQLFPYADPTAHKQVKSIAVLPLDTFSQEQELSYFSDGLAEELIHQLALLPDLKVVSRTASFSFRNSTDDIPEIARKLGITHILEGSVRRPEKDMRITLQLIRAQDGYHEWSKTYDVKTSKLLDTQQRIGHEIASHILPNKKALQAKWATKRYHPSEQAYQYFLKGAAYAGLVTPEGRLKAKEAFKQALKVAPDYALAHTAIAVNHLVSFQHDRLSWEDIAPVAKQHIDLAFKFQPNLAEAHAAFGLYHLYQGQDVEAEEEFKQAISSNANSILAQHNLGFLYWRQSRWQEAKQQYENSIELNPLAPMSHYGLADTMFLTGDLISAIQQYQHCLNILASSSPCQLGYANLLYGIGEFEQGDEFQQLAIELLGKNDFYIRGSQAWKAFMQGDLISAEKQLEKLVTQSYWYTSWRDMTLLQIKKGQGQEWLENLQARLDKTPKNTTLLLSNALTRFYLQDCPGALVFYASAYEINPNLQSRLPEWMLGMSHALNQAYCFQQQGDMAESQALLAQLEQQLESINIGSFQLPGVNLVKSKLAALKGNDKRELAVSLEYSETPLSWLAEIDPLGH